MSSSPFSIEFQTQCDFAELDQDDSVLAALDFSAGSQVHSTHKPLFSLALHNLEQNDVVEIWRSPQPVVTESKNLENGVLQLSRNDAVLFGYLQIAEPSNADLVAATDTAYRHILEQLDNQGFNKLLRIWNYFPAINDISTGLERYRQFCLGRQCAIESFGNFAYAPPAATAIGTQGGDLQIYFIAARTPGIQLENPRQTSAFLYPREYGEVSPAFSRATYMPWNASQNEHLYISGTSSIVGHESKHPGKARQQLRESLDNIEALIRHGHETLNLDIRELGDLSHLKVYLRDATFLPVAREEMTRRLGDHSPVTLYLQGDVCRADLLVEIEAAYLAKSSVSPSSADTA